MNKRQRDNLGLTQIYDLIQAPSSFLVGVKRNRIAHAYSCPPYRITAAHR